MYVNVFNNDLFQESDDQLLERYKNGDEAAVAVLLVRYASLINKYSSRYHLPNIDSDDIKQEAYMGLFSAIRSYDRSDVKNNSASFYTYASCCISNRMNNLLVCATTNKANLNKNAVSFDDIESNSLLLEQNISNPEAIIIQNETYESLISLIKTVLSNFESEVLLQYLNGCDYRFIASKLNSSQKSVDNALQRARRKLKAVLNNL